MYTDRTDIHNHTNVRNKIIMASNNKVMVKEVACMIYIYKVSVGLWSDFYDDVCGVRPFPCFLILIFVFSPPSSLSCLLSPSLSCPLSPSPSHRPPASFLSPFPLSLSSLPPSPRLYSSWLSCSHPQHRKPSRSHLLSSEILEQTGLQVTLSQKIAFCDELL